MFDNLFCEEIFPNIKSKLPLVKLEVIFTCPLFVLLLHNVQEREKVFPPECPNICRSCKLLSQPARNVKAASESWLGENFFKYSGTLCWEISFTPMPNLPNLLPFSDNTSKLLHKKNYSPIQLEAMWKPFSSPSHLQRLQLSTVDTFFFFACLRDNQFIEQFQKSI